MQLCTGEILTQKTTENNLTPNNQYANRIADSKFPHAQSKTAPKDQVGRLLAWALPVSRAQHVSLSREKQLNTLGLQRIADLLYHVPHRYLDLTTTSKLGPVQPGDATVVGTVYEVKNRTTRRPGRKTLTITELTLIDDTGTLIGVWFNQPWVQASYRAGQVLAFSGDVKLRNGLKQITQPFVEKISDAPASTEAEFDSGREQYEKEQQMLHQSTPHALGRILPVHSTTEGLSVGWMRRIIAGAVDDFAAVSEYVPLDIIQAHALPSYSWALHNIHFPQHLDDAHAARRRLAYGELFDLQLMMAKRRHLMAQQKKGHRNRSFGKLHLGLVTKLPFELTPDQEMAVHEILDDMAGDHPMQRLLMGDVGTGKTIVAAFAMAVAADSGGQSAMMAPTEVLAQQYAGMLGPLFDSIGLRWALLTGSTPASQREQIITDLAEGNLHVVFGTHALIEHDVNFKQLTLTIVDEQHRFGVDQRRMLHNKGESADVLVMTATPIPRTLTLTVFGDLAASYLRTRPIEGAGITTKKLKFKNIAKAYKAIHNTVAAGQQAYIVCALVDESSKIEAQSAVQMMTELAAGEFSDYKVEILTGKMRVDEKVAVMDRFRAGDIDVLISTTVIEVGVDVHNATTMLILDADRFGLAQLHQLRGRVGRGSLPGTVYLLSDSFAQSAIERLDALVQTVDGFELAELDLRQRGAGELLGTRQSGIPQFRIANLVQDEELIELAQRDAIALIAKDPQLQDAELTLLRTRIEALEQKLYMDYLS